MQRAAGLNSGLLAAIGVKADLPFKSWRGHARQENQGKKDAGGKTGRTKSFTNQLAQARERTSG